MARPIVATISTANMAHNLQQVKRRVEQQLASAADSLQFIAVVKANAYGHGVVAAVRGFAAADGLAVVEIEQLARLRALGWTKALVLLEGVFEPSDLAVVQAHDVTTVVHCQQQLDWLVDYAQGASGLVQQCATPSQAFKPFNIMLKFNTGMNRLGFKPEQAASVAAQVKALQAQGVVGEVTAMMHFADADAPAPSNALIAPVWERMQAVLQTLSECGLVVKHLSVCNSAASLRYAGTLCLPHYDNIFRPGLCLYGASPMALQAGEQAVDYGLKPAMTLKAKLLAIQTVAAGETVGYGSIFRAPKAMRIGVVACGYADGYPRWANEQTPVVINGQRTTLAGRVSMDMLTIDVTDVPAQVGDWVYLWGEGGPDIDEVVAATGRKGGAYEVLCHLNQRVPKEII